MTVRAGQRSAGEEAWLETRAYMRERRQQLSEAAAERFPDLEKVAGTSLLAAPSWIPENPMPLDALDMSLDLDATFDGVTGEEAANWLPGDTDGQTYRSYSHALGQIAAPAVFENRSTYRLLDADLSGAGARLAFGLGSYFNSIDTGEAAAHEFTLAHLGEPVRSGVREAIGNPCDPRRRPVNVAISTLTIRHDEHDGKDTFFLHWRDPGKVGHAGGMYQVVPVGIFQPSGEASWNLHNDFSLWRNTIREFAEELRGETETYDSEYAPINYQAWPFAARLDQARTSGQLRAYCLGLGVDPLTFATDLLTAVVVDAPLFDDLFGDVVSANAEGHVLEGQRFDKTTVASLLTKHSMQAAGAALLRLAVASDLP